jgi:hypothetical protein
MGTLWRLQCCITGSRRQLLRVGIGLDVVCGVLSTVMNSLLPRPWSMTVIADTVSKPRRCVKRTTSSRNSSRFRACSTACVATGEHRSSSFLNRRGSTPPDARPDRVYSFRRARRHCRKIAACETAHDLTAPPSAPLPLPGRLRAWPPVLWQAGHARVRFHHLGTRVTFPATNRGPGVPPARPCGRRTPPRRGRRGLGLGADAARRGGDGRPDVAW